MNIHYPLHGCDLIGIKTEHNPCFLVCFHGVTHRTGYKVVKLVILQNLEVASDSRLQLAKCTLLSKKVFVQFYQK